MQHKSAFFDKRFFLALLRSCGLALFFILMTLHPRTAMDIRILVTGLNGIIGWNIFQKAAEKYETSGTYRKNHPALRGAAIHRVDMHDERELEDLFRNARPDYLIHSWAMCDLDLCEQMPEMARKINDHGAEKIIAAASKCKSLKKFVYISTDHVFSGERGEYTENDRPDPKHVYGRTKVEAEKRVQASGLPYLIIRPGLAIGKSLQGNKGPRDFLFTRIRAGKTTHYFTDEWRTPIPAEMLGEKIVDLAVSDTTGIRHVAGSELISRFDLAKRLAFESGLPTEKILPRLRKDDRWAPIRPKNIGLKTIY